MFAKFRHLACRKDFDVEMEDLLDSSSSHIGIVVSPRFIRNLENFTSVSAVSTVIARYAFRFSEGCISLYQRDDSGLIEAFVFSLIPPECSLTTAAAAIISHLAAYHFTLSRPRSYLGVIDSIQIRESDGKYIETVPVKFPEVPWGGVTPFPRGNGACMFCDRIVHIDNRGFLVQGPQPIKDE